MVFKFENFGLRLEMEYDDDMRSDGELKNDGTGLYDCNGLEERSRERKKVLLAAHLRSSTGHPQLGKRQ